MASRGNTEELVPESAGGVILPSPIPSPLISPLPSSLPPTPLTLPSPLVPPPERAERRQVFPPSGAAANTPRTFNQSALTHLSSFAKLCQAIPINSKCCNGFSLVVQTIFSPLSGLQAGAERGFRPAGGHYSEIERKAERVVYEEQAGRHPKSSRGYQIRKSYAEMVVQNPLQAELDWHNDNRNIIAWPLAKIFGGVGYAIGLTVRGLRDSCYGSGSGAIGAAIRGFCPRGGTLPSKKFELRNRNLRIKLRKNTRKGL